MDLFWNILFYICLGFAFYHFIYKKFQKEGILTAIGIMLTVYTLCYNSMNDDYNARKIVINSWAEKAVDHLREFKDGDLAAKVARMQLVDKPNYFKISDVLRYRSNKQELADKKLDVSYADYKLVIKIDGEIIPESEYMVDNKIEWIKIYAKLDIEQYVAELIKKEFEVMARNGVFAGTKVGDEWKGAKLQGLWLHGAKLYNTQLQGAYLNMAQLQGARLYRAQLQGAVIEYYNQESRESEEILLTDTILEETHKYKDDLPNFTGVKNIETAIFSDDKEINDKVIAKIKQMYKL